MARPKKTNKTEVVALSIRIPQELHRSIKEIADNEERTLNWIITRLLHQGLEIYLIEKNKSGEKLTKF